MSRDAMVMLEEDDWPGNVRELDAVMTRAMLRRRCGWVTPEDVILPKLRRGRLPDRVRALEPSWTSVQRRALRLLSARGEVRRGDLVLRCGVSGEVARRALVGLVGARVVQREGSGRGTRYVPRAGVP